LNVKYGAIGSVLTKSKTIMDVNLWSYQLHTFQLLVFTGHYVPIIFNFI
jgi:hypothetical protein